RFGRLAAHDRTALERMIGPATKNAAKPQTLDEIVDFRAQYLGEHPDAAHATAPFRAKSLADYQDAALAEKFRSRVARIAELERSKAPRRAGLAEAVRRGYHKQ